MLKSANYKDSFDSSSNHGSLPVVAMTENEIQTYFSTELEHTTKPTTLTIIEWTKFLHKINIHQNHYILTEEQLLSIISYCRQNEDLEMTPEEFVRFLYHIRSSVPQPNTASATKKLLESRRRSAKLFSSGKSTSTGASVHNYYEDGASLNHPDSSSYMSPINNHHEDNESSAALLKERQSVTRQFRDYENNLTKMSLQYSERISKLTEKLEIMAKEATELKQQLVEHKKGEKEKITRIEELQENAIDTLEKYKNLFENLEKTQKDLSSLNKTHGLAISQLKQKELELHKAKDSASTHERDLAAQIEQNLKLRQELEKEIAKNKILNETVEIQKFKLDELEVKLSSSNETLMTDNTNNSTQNETYLALEVEYTKKIESLSKGLEEKNNQLEEIQKNFDQSQKDLAQSISIQENQSEVIKQLSSQFDQQHQITKDIKLSLLNYTSSTVKFTSNTYVLFLSGFCWLYTVYHFATIAIEALSHNTHSYGSIFAPLHIIEYIDHWLSSI